MMSALERGPPKADVVRVVAMVFQWLNADKGEGEGAKSPTF